MADTSSRKMRLYSADDVAKHSSATDCWLIYHGKVYNLTDFVEDHPGGDDLILRYAGKDMGEVMSDPMEHSHSDSAYEVLDEYLIGRLPTSDAERDTLANVDYKGKDDNFVLTDDFHPSETDGSADYKKHAFLDLNKPLIRQMWNAKFSKEFYLEQVHNPRHLKQPARLFGPDFLEMFTRTPWYVVPMVWVPVAAAIFYRATTQFQASHGDTPLAVTQTTLCWAVGVVIWTILEYVLHRFLFHIDSVLPDRPFFLMLHFLLHGVHHYLPMDRLRLVMPPLLFFVLSYPFTQLAHVLFPRAVANGIISGSFSMCKSPPRSIHPGLHSSSSDLYPSSCIDVVYDCMHYALHHTKLPQYMREMKQYHLEHHYKNFELGFGVTSKIWDYVFGTVL